MPITTSADFVAWFRSVAPYINAFRGRTFVIAFGGEVVADGKFVELTHDFNLLASLGIRLVLVHGARPQIEQHLAKNNLGDTYHHGIRLTDAETMQCVKEAVGRVRVEIEALLSMGLANSPMANADIRVAGGNFITAQPIGVINGVDLQHTGSVRKVDVAALNDRMEFGEVVLLSPFGYSPTGEVFNLTLEDVATATAIALDADKLMFLMDTDGVHDKKGALLKELTIAQAQDVLTAKRKLPDDVALFLPCAVRACEAGVARTHLISRHTDGAVLQELFSDEGIGTMVVESTLNTLRDASIEDIGGILELLRPLEENGILVRRSRELLEREDRPLRGAGTRPPHRRLRRAVSVPGRSRRRTGRPRGGKAKPRSRLRRSHPQPHALCCQDAEDEKAVRTDHAHRALVHRARFRRERCFRAARTEEVVV